MIKAKDINILAIETSCDETAAAVVRNGRKILSNVVASSLKDHQKYGGIIPEIASRRQLELIAPIVAYALDRAKVKLAEMDAFAVTKAPGLIGSLLVGISYARALSLVFNKPLVEIDHIKAHLYANFLSFQEERKSKGEAQDALPKLPAIGLIVSGGHTSLYFIKDVEHFELLGRTRDDAAGEAFDKVARILELGYPGGPVIDRLATKGNNQDIRFAYADLPGTLDFSFSGVKTAVLYYKQKHHKNKSYDVSKIAYSFQKSIVSILIKKCLHACEKTRVKTLLLGGGVAANSYLREELKQAARLHKIRLFCPPLSLCMDNAAMIGGLGYHLLKTNNKFFNKRSLLCLNKS